MNKMTSMLAVTVALAATFVATVSIPALAGELDPTALGNAPQGLVVKVGADGKHEVFKVNLKSGVVDNDTTAVEVLNTLTQENKVESVEPMSELDRVSSDESWHFSWNYGSRYYSYGYRCGSSYYSYYPSYSYSYRGYSYNYYYTPVYYGYRSCGSIYDYYGYHYRRGYGWF